MLYFDSVTFYWSTLFVYSFLLSLCLTSLFSFSSVYFLTPICGALFHIICQHVSNKSHSRWHLEKQRGENRTYCLLAPAIVSAGTQNFRTSHPYIWLCCLRSSAEISTTITPEVNLQLDKMGYNIGVRLIERFLALRQGAQRCANFRETRRHDQQSCLQDVFEHHACQ